MPPVLNQSEAILYIISLPQAVDLYSDCLRVLTPDETERMQRFCSFSLQQNFALTRGLLRFILAQYLQLSPADIVIEYNQYGKPFLKDNALQFNLAHSGDYCAVALTKTDLIGVDIEHCLFSHKPYYEIAKRFFTPQEYKVLLHAPISVGEELFYHMWTQKEAFLKAIGHGLTFGLDRFEVATQLDESAVTYIQEEALRSRIWSSRSYGLPTGYRTTLTKENILSEVHWLDFDLKSIA